MCDANAKIFRIAVRGVKDTSPDGFAAIKLSGLGDPILLERMSSCLVETCRLFQRISADDCPSQDLETLAPFYTIDRSFMMDFDTFHHGWSKLFAVDSKEDMKAVFNAIDTDQCGEISYIDWSNSMRLSSINELVRSCRQQGRLYRSALDKKELELYMNMIKRVENILDLAQELGVRVMIDAEWTDIQPAIDHIVLHMQRKYNKGDTPTVFNTYQTDVLEGHGPPCGSRPRSLQEGGLAIRSQAGAWGLHGFRAGEGQAEWLGVSDQRDLRGDGGELPQVHRFHPRSWPFLRSQGGRARSCCGRAPTGIPQSQFHRAYPARHGGNKWE
ncbi:unnamed protein product [Polarella glacialis]|uniref:Proline dehydrogenase n=1 Tax=Polarella glacialis TaxID=89957 RepID=A0A813E4I0_POLGL|nr:unnamed protein product [Polarella glacialis]